MIRTLTLSAALAAVVLSGCGKKDADTKGETKKDEAPVAATAPAVAQPAAEPAKRIEPRSLPPAECPAGTTLTALDSSKDLSAVGPFDLGKFTEAIAESAETGGEVTVYLSNKLRSVERYNALPSPVEEKGGAYLKLRFTSKDSPVTAMAFREKQHTEDETVYLGVSLFVKDLSIGVDLGESKAEILAVTDSHVCGTFALHGKHEFDGRKTHFEGTFVAPISLK